MAEKKSHSTLLVQTTSRCLFVVVVVVVVVVVGRGRGCGLGWVLIQGWALIYQTTTVHTVQRFVRYVIFDSRLKGWSLGKRMS